MRRCSRSPTSRSATWPTGARWTWRPGTSRGRRVRSPTTIRRWCRWRTSCTRYPDRPDSPGRLAVLGRCSRCTWNGWPTACSSRAARDRDISTAAHPRHVLRSSSPRCGPAGGAFGSARPGSDARAPPRGRRRRGWPWDSAVARARRSTRCASTPSATPSRRSCSGACSAGPAPIPGLVLAAHCAPAVRRIDIGGDFYDVFDALTQSMVACPG